MLFMHHNHNIYITLYTKLVSLMHILKSKFQLSVTISIVCVKVKPETCTKLRNKPLCTKEVRVRISNSVST